MFKRLLVPLSLSTLLAAGALAQEKPLPKEPKLNFGEAYSRILGRSLRVREQRLDIEASEARRWQRLGAFTPSLAAEISNTNVGATPTGASDSAKLAARLNVFSFGSDVAGLRAADKDRERSRESLLSERQVAEEEAARALVKFIARVRQKQITGRIVQLKAESLRIARERFEKGHLPQQEVDKVAIELELSRARLIDAEAAEAQSRAGLESALGSDKVSADWPWKESLSQNSPLESWEFQLAKRPDWRAALANRESESLKKRAVAGALLPSVDLIGEYGNFNLAQPSRRDWAAIVKLTVPLFDSYRSISAYQLQALNESVAELRLESLKRQAPAEVESLRQNFRAARASALTREKTAQITERLYADNLQRFRLGRASANELAQDQTRLYEAQLSEIEGWSNAHLTFMGLCHGLGGFVAPNGKCETEVSDL